MKRLSLFPRSLRQLVTLSFVLILLPLLVLAWQAWQSLNALSAQAAHINLPRYAVKSRRNTPPASDKQCLKAAIR